MYVHAKRFYGHPYLYSTMNFLLFGNSEPTGKGFLPGDTKTSCFWIFQCLYRDFGEWLTHWILDCPLALSKVFPWSVSWASCLYKIHHNTPKWKILLLLNLLLIIRWKTKAVRISTKWYGRVVTGFQLTIITQIWVTIFGRMFIVWHSEWEWWQ